MGMLDRFTDIMKANVNAVLSKMEDANANKLLEQYIRETRESLGKVKAETAAIMADEMSALRKLDQQKEEIQKFESYAMKAVEAGNDTDARKFLTHKVQLTEKLADLEQNYARAAENSKKMKEMAQKLSGDLVAYEGKLKELKMNIHFAEQQEKMNTMNTGAGSLSKFDEMAAKVQKRVDAAAAAVQLEKELSSNTAIDELVKKYESGSSTQGQSIEDELLALKSKMNQ